MSTGFSPALWVPSGQRARVTRACTPARDEKPTTYYYYDLGWRLVLNSEGLWLEPSGGASTDSPQGSQRYVTYFVDRARRVNGTSPPRRVIGTIAKEVDALVKEGTEPDHLLTGIDILVDKGLDPTQLASCVFTAQARMKDGMSREDLKLLNEFLDAEVRPAGLRWPTGSRWRRGAAAGTFVQDTLGLDRPPYNVPWSSPSKREIVQALRERMSLEHSGTDTDRSPAGTAEGARPDAGRANDGRGGRTA